MTLLPLDPAWAARLARIPFRSRMRAEGRPAGRHTSPLKGRSGEFEDRRAYVPGDDSRRVDWNVYARTDRWTVREEREDTTLRAMLLLDGSRSMLFSHGGRLSKQRWAARLLGALAWLLIRRGESAGLGWLDEGHGLWHAPRAGRDQLIRLLTGLDRPPERTGRDMAGPLQTAAERLTRRGVVVVASDFLAPLEAVLKALRGMRSAGQDVVAFEILDPTELNFDIDGARTFVDLESNDTVALDPALVGRAYRQCLRDHRAALMNGLTALSVDHHLFTTDRCMEEQLAVCLRRRAGWSRGAVLH